MVDLPPLPSPPPSIEATAARIAGGDRTALARAITLVESTRADHQLEARELITKLLPLTERATRIGITGVPGAGKSTFIDALGTMLTAQGHKIAVLAVDPSSTRTGGSILGDKTRMARLAVDADAFIRPSPTGGSLGGVAAKTREAMLLTEAAGYDVVLVETVGVGQSEVAVAGMVDCFVALMAPGTGDDLQGIKKGLFELADIVLVNKADGESIDRAQRAATDYRAALNIVTPHGSAWMPPVLTVSALTGSGLDAFWAQVQAHRTKMQATGAFARKRTEQRLAWMWTAFEARTMAYVRTHPTLRSRLPDLERAVRDGELPPSAAVDEMWRALGLPE